MAFNAAAAAALVLALATASDPVQLRRLDAAAAQAKCPCIGIKGMNGQISAKTGDTMTMYPASTGAHCSAWDENTHPACKAGSPPAWCASQWCFVDPCNCALKTPPAASAYLPSGKYQGLHVFWSSAACGAADDYTENALCVSKADQTACDSTYGCRWASGSCLKHSEAMTALCGKQATATWGKSHCKCLGISGLNGTVDVKAESTTVQFDASMGSKCAAWDSDRYPLCKGENQPAWCLNKWCFVDPCTCAEGEPVLNTYMPGATARGRALYHSFRTCALPSNPASEPLTCSTHVDEAACKTQSDCSWMPTGGKARCVGSTVATACKKDPSLNTADPSLNTAAAAAPGSRKLAVGTATVLLAVKFLQVM